MKNNKSEIASQNSFNKNIHNSGEYNENYEETQDILNNKKNKEIKYDTSKTDSININAHDL